LNPLPIEFGKIDQLAKTCLKQIIELHAELIFGLNPDPTILQKSESLQHEVDACTSGEVLYNTMQKFNRSIHKLKHTYIITGKQQTYNGIITKWRAKHLETAKTVLGVI
jgi:hypothetical protein